MLKNARKCKKVRVFLLKIAKKCAFLLKSAEKICVFGLILTRDVVGQYIVNGSVGKSLRASIVSCTATYPRNEDELGGDLLKDADI